MSFAGQSCQKVGAVACRTASQPREADEVYGACSRCRMVDNVRHLGGVQQREQAPCIANPARRARPNRYPGARTSVRSNLQKLDVFWIFRHGTCREYCCGLKPALPRSRTFQRRLPPGVNHLLEWPDLCYNICWTVRSKPDFDQTRLGFTNGGFGLCLCGWTWPWTRRLVRLDGFKY